MKGPQGVVVAEADAVKDNDIASLPDYIDDYTLGASVQGYVWQTIDDKPNILTQPDGTKTAACWFNAGDFTVDLPLNRRKTRDNLAKN